MVRTSLLLLLAATSLPLGAQPAREALPQVVILATGGTIAGTARTATEASYEVGTLAVDVLIDAVPELAEVARVRGEQVAQIASQDMTDAIWLRLAQRVEELLGSEEVDGIVITHGTDTMEESAYFLHLVVHSPKPVVLTGALRPATALSADGPLNLYNAVAVAASPEARDRGVMVVLHDTIHCGREVTKTHTTATDAFASPGAGPLGVVEYGKVRFFRQPTRTHTGKSQLSVSGLEELPRVDIIHAHANMRGDLIDAAVAAGARGLVIAGTGNGNMSQPALDAVTRAVEKGVVVVRSSRVGGGVVSRNIEIDDDALGLAAADDLIPAKARVLLKLALTRTSSVEEVQQLFIKY